ncbi:hypothetical protein FY534_08030 [Alicyclobacillus sp. TC]|uniref:Uncharacterized protein n=1 Tax=Alicyclobacillus tolerans TaxID=90970 RepID=A0ABT9LXG2_9BACL|nr:MULTISPECIES: hypothetical protein [Alicyclobacillus]MDP9728950.1 hypothetical protein [Alicyclobacillus tengchongensis]QRF23626.1 hypothetical protein FY534_08030 [Alicyclobacillus sp. TC]
MANDVQLWDSKVLERLGLTEEAAKELLEHGITLEEYAESIGQSVKEEIQDAKVILPRYKINGKHWQDNAGDLKSELTGIVIEAKTNRALFDREDEENPRLLCRSLDGKQGTVFSEEGGIVEQRICSTCPFNQFVADESGKRRRACKETRRLYFLEDGASVPTLIYLPPTSHKVWDHFATSVLGKGQPLSGRRIRLTLELKTEGSRSWGVLKTPETLEVYTGLALIQGLKRSKEIAETLNAMIQQEKPETVAVGE